MTPIIRAALPEDDAALRSIDVATWSPDNSPGPASSPTAPFFGPGNRPEDFLVALVDGEVAGYIKLALMLPLESASHVLEIQGLAVAPARGRRGLGRSLLSAAVARAAAGGARKLTLRVLGPNAVARALYESEGFIVEGRLKDAFFLGGRYVDDVLMARALSQ